MKASLSLSSKGELSLEQKGEKVFLRISNLHGETMLAILSQDEVSLARRVLELME